MHVLKQSLIDWHVVGGDGNTRATITKVKGASTLYEVKETETGDAILVIGFKNARDQAIKWATL